MDIAIVGDNKGVLTAISTHSPKTPAEPHLTHHVRAVREQLDKKQVKQLVWVDTRDMTADPLTKSKTLRNPLNDVLNDGE